MSLCRTLMAALMALSLIGTADAEEDHRAWQHGVNVVQLGERWLVVWGSPGNPPRPNLGGDWQHDVYYAWLNAPSAGDVTLSDPKVLVARAEAQEPPSVAVNAAGTLLMTSEDGSDGINQYAGMWDSNLKVLRAYPFMVRRGGHSGHVAAMGDRFLISYGEDWVDHGGFLDRGTGKDIHVRIIENNGKRGKEIDIASGHRDGWPLVAGSDRNWMVVWQRYPDMTLHSVLVDAKGKLSSSREISQRMPIRYAYDLEFVPGLAAYVVAGSSGEAGFVARLNLSGEIENIQHGLPPMVSESRILTRCDGKQCIGVYPVRPKGVAVVRLSAGGTELLKLIDTTQEWDYMGTAGAFVTPERVVFATLTTSGIRLVSIALPR
ncbi:MAG TPA: hypothetical protein VL381_05830 [Rhodocyclaceae bacterium]|nr:hypothetical protein [Rhodocyclaceae bacterium]